MLRPSPQSAPFDEEGHLKPEAYKNVLVALLLKQGGEPLTLTHQELAASNHRQFEYHQTESGLEFRLIERQEGHA